MSNTPDAAKTVLEGRSLGLGGLSPGTVQLTVREGISARELHAALDRILKLHGCTACGLNGLDLLLRPQGDLVHEFKDIKGVADVSIIAGR